MKVNDRTPDRTALWATVMILLLAVSVMLAAIVMVFDKPANASTGRSGTAVLTPNTPIIATVTAPDLVPLVLDAATTEAQPGEGVIRITTRVCGNANNWQAVAAANGVVATSTPAYLVLLGQKIIVSCTGSPTPQSTAVQPKAVPPASSGWAAPLCGVLGDALGAGRNHKGQDIAARQGTPIHAAAGGNVSTAYQSGGAGNYTMIDHGNGTWTVYMHLSEFAVRSGWVNADQVIGYVGSTGNSTGPHLHFEVHPWGLWQGVVSPVDFLAARGVSLRC